MSAREEQKDTKLSRRKFVALAGVAALSATGAPALGAEAKGASKAKKPVAAEPAAAPPAAPAMTPHQKEYERQKASTLGTLKTIRAVALPPGGDLPVVFKPMRTPKKGH